MYHTTGFDREEIIDICIRINSVERAAGSVKWPPCLGLFKSVIATLTYMRHNRTQAEIGESLGVSQPTVSRAVSAITPLIPEAVREFIPTAGDLDPDAPVHPGRYAAPVLVMGRTQGTVLGKARVPRTLEVAWLISDRERCCTRDEGL